MRQNDGLLDVVQQLSHALEEAAKTEDEMRLVNAAMHRNEKDQTAEMAQLQGAVAIQRNAQAFVLPGSDHVLDSALYKAVP